MDHWSRAALRRLANAGLVHPGTVLQSWPLPRSVVRWLFRTALRDSQAGSQAQALTEVARNYVARFDADYPYIDSLSAVGGSLEAGWVGANNELRTGLFVPSADGYDYAGPVSLGDMSHGLVAVHADVRIGSRMSASMEVRDSVGPPHLESAVLTARWGAVQLWAGRKPFALGLGERGGFILTEGVEFDGVGFMIPEGFKFGGFLRVLGAIHTTAVVARMERNGNIRHPGFGAARVSLSPHPSFVFGLQRAAMFGGEGNEGITVKRLFLMLVGQTDETAGKTTGFENQVASIDFFWKLPSLPIALYGEWASDDAGYGFRNVPALMFGMEGARVPGVNTLSVGAEHVYMAPSRRTYPAWYHHGTFAEGWADHGRLLGHPLAGHGHETALLVRADAARVLGEVRAFVRERGRDNLFSPERAGSAFGFDSRIVAQPSRLIRVRANALFERSDAEGWNWSALLAVGLSLRPGAQPIAR